jgi:putative PIN family toxin of toxin-antitoxin system
LLLQKSGADDLLHMPMTPKFLRAYQKALYAVLGGPVLRLGERNAELETLLEAQAAATAAFVTAANPRGELRSDAANQAAMAELQAGLAWPSYPGEGRDPEGRWPAEPSLLIVGIPRGEAEALGRRFEQNAIVFVEKGSAPELALLRKMRLVIDTQVWIDWLVFDDASVTPIRHAIAADRAEVFIDQACLAELERVLAYPLGKRTVDVAGSLAQCFQHSRQVEIKPVEKLPVCRDPDDQKFLELAAAVRADCLITRDRELLRLARRCAPLFQILAPEDFSKASDSPAHGPRRGASP